jgi:hypothetical protein
MTCPLCKILVVVNPLVVNKESPFAFLWTGHKQGPAVYAYFKFNTVKTIRPANTEVPGTTPMPCFTDLRTLVIEYRSPFIVAAS